MCPLSLVGGRRYHACLGGGQCYSHTLLADTLAWRSVAPPSHGLLFKGCHINGALQGHPARIALRRGQSPTTDVARISHWNLNPPPRSTSRGALGSSGSSGTRANRWVSPCLPVLSESESSRSSQSHSYTVTYRHHHGLQATGAQGPAQARRDDR